MQPQDSPAARVGRDAGAGDWPRDDPRDEPGDDRGDAGTWRTVAREQGVLGEVVLRRRSSEGAALHELVVGGVLLMDDRDTSTERLLAQAALQGVSGRRLRVLVGGLGLGFTLAATLADPRVVRVVVAELEPVLPRWLAAGLVPATAGVLDDPRVQLQVADVREVLAGLPAASVDAVLLDVDNGPGFLVHERNAGVYGHGTLARAATALRPGGVVAVWSSARAPALLRTLQDVVGRCEERVVTVSRGGRDLEYVLYLARSA